MTYKDTYHVLTRPTASLKAVNTNQWPINNLQNLAIPCTKRVTVVRQILFLAHTSKKKSGLATRDYIGRGIGLELFRIWIATNKSLWLNSYYFFLICYTCFHYSNKLRATNLIMNISRIT